MKKVSRDPFARVTLCRETVKLLPLESYYGIALRCAWCGGTNARGNVYRYRVETDGGYVFPDDRTFCSVDCRRSFLS